MFINNNCVDLVGEGFDYVICFGDGVWYGVEVECLFEVLLVFMCVLEIVVCLCMFFDLVVEMLLWFYCSDEWYCWFVVVVVFCLFLCGFVFDFLLVLVEVVV